MAELELRVGTVIIGVKNGHHDNWDVAHGCDILVTFFTCEWLAIPRNNYEWEMKYLTGEVCAKYASRDEKVWINMSQLWNNMTVNVGIT